MRAILNRITNLMSRAVVRRVVDTGKLQTLQADALADETRDVERMQNYGFTGVPPSGSEAVIVFVGGRREHGIAVAVDDRRCRLSGLEQGEVAVYTDQGDKVVIRRGGTIEVTASTKVVVTTPVVELAGNVDAVAKGAALNSALTTFGTAIATALGAMGAAGPTTPIVGTAASSAQLAVTNAVTALNIAAQAALSTKVKLS